MSYRRSLVVLMLMLAVLFAACASAAGGDPPAQMREIETTTAETTTETTTEETTTEKLLTPVDVNVMMIGDMLLHTNVQKSGIMSDGSYNYDHLFEHIQEEIEWADLAVVNQEVIIGGKAIGIKSYPCFNCVEEVGDAIVKAGFNVVLHATNHTWDMGEKGLTNCLNYWKENHPEEIVLGVHATQEDADKITVWEKDGFKIAMLNYTYGLNGFKVTQGKEYLVDLLDKDKVTDDIRRAKEQADFVIVFPHWGTEYTFKADEMQTEWAQLFAAEGVDLVIGAHPHVVEPVEWVESSQGNRTLVYYSLGNYVSAQDKAYTMLGGMAKVTIHRDEHGEVSISSYDAVPLVTHRGDGSAKSFGTYILTEYPESKAKKNKVIAKDSRFSIEYVTNLWNKTMGEEFAIQTDGE